MFGKRITIFKLLGFSVRIDLSWVVIAALVTWTLAAGYFPFLYEGLSPAAYWAMGAAGALGLFVSIIIHEFSHSLVARRYGLPITGITLFIFGGVAEMSEEPDSPKTEFLMAIAGPIASVVLAGLFYGLYVLAEGAGLPVPLVGVAGYLALINLVVAVFNMIPAFPLDGGRVLRAGLWHLRGSVREATRLAAKIGGGFGLALILLGAFTVITGNFISGLWWVLIGFFLRHASSVSYSQLYLREMLTGYPVKRFMKREVETVAPGITVQQLVDGHFYRSYHKLYPVVADGRLKGAVGLAQVKKLGRGEWARKKVAEIMEPVSRSNSVRADEDAMEALTRMSRDKRTRMLVVDGNGALAGILTMKDLQQFFSLKLDLEQDQPPAAKKPV